MEIAERNAKLAARESEQQEAAIADAMKETDEIPPVETQETVESVEGKQETVDSVEGKQETEMSENIEAEDKKAEDSEV